MYSLSLYLVLAFTESEHVGTALKGDADGVAWSGCRPLDVSEDVGCTLTGVRFDVIANEEVLYFDVLAAIADTCCCWRCPAHTDCPRVAWWVEYALSPISP